MWLLLGKINKNLIYAIPAMLLAGFGFGIVVEATFLKTLILPFTFLMVYPMMVNLKLKQVFNKGDGRAQLVTQAINFLVIPFVAYWTGQLFFSDKPYMALGLLLAALVPTSGMTISWTGFAGGNLGAAVKMTVIGLILGSLATPFYVKALLGTSVEVDLMRVFQQIVLIVFLPMAAGYATQRLLVKRYGQDDFKKRLAPRFPGLSTLGVLGIVFIAMALKAPAIATQPGQLVSILVPLALLYLFNFGLSTIVGRVFLQRADAIAMVYGTVMRNLSIALAVAINAFGPAGSDAALVIALAYVIQVQSAAWYVKFTPALFGPVEMKQQPA
ncbi:MAG: arsenite transporter [Desulfuromonas sp.]|nr:MAG: arsenite transporter [Desulfuromonas sp.]